MKWTVVKAGASRSIKQSAGDDLLLRGEQGLCSVCILYMFWWRCGLCWGIFLKHEMIITLRVEGKKWLGLANWNLWLSLHFISIKSFSFFAVITPHSRSNPWITLCLFPPRRTPRSSSAKDVSKPPAPLPPSFSRIIPCRPLQLCCPSVLSPRTQIKMAPSFFHQIQGVYMRALLVRGVTGVLCNQIDLCRAHQTDEPGRSAPGLNSMHDTLICHALARTCPPAKTLSWLPSWLAPYSLSSLEGKTQAQNGCHCTVLWISEDGCALMSRRKKGLKSALYVPEELKNIFIRRSHTSDPSCKSLVSVWRGQNLFLCILFTIILPVIFFY